jgi:methionine-rich copper-binding protein CopC
MHKPERIAAFVVFSMVAATQTLNAREPLRMQVSPAVTRAPAMLTVRVSLETAADNRLLQVVAESADFYRSSEIQIDGANAPAISVFEFHNLPTGLYHVTGVLVGVDGRRALVSRLAKVEPPFGR